MVLSSAKAGSYRKEQHKIIAAAIIRDDIILFLFLSVTGTIFSSIFLRVS